ncbi:MAG TPA: hypothetical protein VJ767_01500 [Nitrososphaeraceae archaeon]|nr:hypothetical protein [Nitrososphaeraceae archaeon]
MDSAYIALNNEQNNKEIDKELIDNLRIYLGFDDEDDLRRYLKHYFVE